jgi:single-stranded-DNA-specific exonuclease
LTALPASLVRLLEGRGWHEPHRQNAFLEPSLDHLGSPDLYPDMAVAVAAVRAAVNSEAPIGIYADRDVDGLTGLAILVRSFRALGGHVFYSNPVLGRGVERAGLESLLAQGCRLVILVDCGTGESTELAWLAEQGVEVIVADHHRIGQADKALAWIHPGKLPSDMDEKPAGCGLAFKLAHGVWRSFLGDDKPRLDYFLFDHLDLVALGILADRVPLTGENRVLVWHGLRRLARTRKTGLASLMRFFRMTPRSCPITVREATWRIIPMLNAAGRLRQPGRAAELLITEDSATASACIDDLIGLNTQRREAQDVSLTQFETLIETQCDTTKDVVLVAIGEGLEPTVTGLAAQSLARKFNRPAFLFVKQGEFAVGSVRGIEEDDLYAWVAKHQDLIIKFGGHAGAVGMTIRSEDFPALKARILEGERTASAVGAPPAEISLALHEADADWWMALLRLDPFGPGFPMPVFAITALDGVARPNPRRKKEAVLRSGAAAWPACLTPETVLPEGPCTVIAIPEPTPKATTPFQWNIQEVQPHHVQVKIEVEA